MHLARCRGMHVVRSSGFTLVEVVMASAVAAVLMAGVLTAAGAVTVQLRQSEQTWKAADAVSQALDQWRTLDAAGARDRDGWRLAVDESGALTEVRESVVPVFTVVVRASVPTGWPSGAVRVEACAYRGAANGNQPAYLCLLSGVRGGL